MSVLSVCNEAIYDRMTKGPEHKESQKPCAPLFMERQMHGREGDVAVGPSREKNTSEFGDNAYI